MRIALAACVALAATGCAMVGPDYQRPASPLPAAYGESAPSVGVSVPRSWWTMYGDTTIDELVRSGLERNADRACRQEVEGRNRSGFERSRKEEALKEIDPQSA